MDAEQFIAIIHSKRANVFWSTLAAGILKFFRTEVEGLENIPKDGPAIIIPNHSGFAGTDAIVLSHLIHKHCNTMPKIVAHPAYFELFRAEKLFFKSFGFTEANFSRTIPLLKKGEKILIFPEAEQGNFKGSLKRYQLQDFHTGYLRLAIRANCPIIPCTVIGAEESHLNLGTISLDFIRKNLTCPVPLNLIPLPAKWHIRFDRPMTLPSEAAENLDNRAWLRKESDRHRSHLQKLLLQGLRRRKYIYFKRPWPLNKILK